MQSADQLTATVEAAWPAALWQDLPVLVAVSGGADSTALLLALAELRPAAARGSLIVAHLDHQLRDDSADDAEAVARLATSLGLALVSRRAGPLPRGPGLESAARKARYEFFRQAAHEHGARYVATAHTADDQAETVLHRVVRGTGLRGLAGIPRLRPLSPWTTMVRPLLDVARAEVEAYLESRGASWRADSSNQQLHATRNRLRRRLLPELRKHVNPRVDDALRRLAQQAEAAHRALEQAADSLLQAAAGRIDGGAVDLDADPLRRADEAVALEALRLAWRRAEWPEQAMDSAAWHRLLSAASQPASPFELPGAVRVARDGRWLRLSRTEEDNL